MVGVRLRLFQSSELDYHLLYIVSKAVAPGYTDAGCRSVISKGLL